MALRGAAVVLLWLGVLGGAAVAHALPVGTSPTEGAILTGSPGTVAIVFDEPIMAGHSTLAVHNETGQVVATGGSPDGGQLTAFLGPLADGAYTVTWVAVGAADGHTTRGSFDFRIGAGPLLAYPSAAKVVPRGEPIGGLARVLSLLGLAVWIGLLPAWRRMPAPLAPPRLSGWVAGIAWVGPLAVALGRVVEAAAPFLVRAQPAVALWPWLASPYGRASVIAVVLALLAAALAGWAVARHGHPWRSWVYVGLGVAAAVAFAASGHAAGSPAAVAVEAVHAVAAGLWVGCTVLVGALLCLLPDRGVGAIARALQRLAPLAALTGGLTLFTGLTNAALRLGRADALTSAGYGSAVLFKGTLVALLAAAGVAHWVLRRRPEPARYAVRWLLTAEAVLGMLVLGATAALSMQPAPESGRQAGLPPPVRASARPPDPAALVRTADRAMDGLRTAHLREYFTSQNRYDWQAVGEADLRAPDRMVSPGVFIDIGASRYVPLPGGGWRRLDGLPPERFPDFHYAQGATHVTYAGTSSLDGQTADVVAFEGAAHGTRLRFRVWIDRRTQLYRLVEMQGPGHHMLDVYSDFDRPVDIAVPLTVRAENDSA